MYSHCKKHLFQVSRTKLVVRRPPSFSLGSGVFAPSSSEPSPLRTLTLGLLVTSGGILAALPFRRYPDVGNNAASHATGPAHTPLDANYVPAAWKMEAVDPAALAIETVPTSDAQLVSERPWPTQIAPPPRRRPDVPLTLADLAHPIEQPGVMAERFNATVEVHEQKLEQERQELVMPKIDLLDEDQRDELQRASSRFTRATATASLASAGRSNSLIEPLPPSAPVERSRNWIRQPE